MATSDLAAYERVEIQMSMVVPLLRDLQAILGDDVVLDALAERHRRRVEAAGSRARTDVPFEKRIRRIERDFASFAEGDALEYAWALLRVHWAHPDFLEGPRAVGEKRPPRWNPDPNARTENES